MLSIPEENIERYFAFCVERHAIYDRRKHGEPWPWTDDPILRKYKFTNIFRELDTGTVWLRENIREPYANDKELFFNIASYRLYNLIGTAEKIGYIHDFSAQFPKIMKTIRTMRANDEQIFTGAHMITGTLGGDKIHQVFNLCMNALWKSRWELEPIPGVDTLESAFNNLNKHSPGFGPFISYEVVSDLRWTRFLNTAPDINTWANPGPGAMRGLDRLRDLPVRGKISKKGRPSRHQYIAMMRTLLSIHEDYVPRMWFPKMEMRDIEHSLCEWDKYERARTGEGKPRSTYTPPHLRQV